MRDRDKSQNEGERGGVCGRERKEAGDGVVRIKTRGREESSGRKEGKWYFWKALFSLSLTEDDNPEYSAFPLIRATRPPDLQSACF